MKAVSFRTLFLSALAILISTIHNIEAAENKMGPILSTLHKLNKRSVDNSLVNPNEVDENRAHRIQRDVGQNFNRNKRQTVNGGGLTYGITPLRPGMNMGIGGQYSAGIGTNERHTVILPENYHPGQAVQQQGLFGGLFGR